MTYVLAIILTVCLGSLGIPFAGHACHKEGGATHKDCGGGGGGGGGGDPVPGDPDIAYVKELDNSSAIFVANADGSDERLVVQSTSDRWYESVSWSPDRTKLALGTDGADTGIYVVEMEFVNGEWLGDWTTPRLIAHRTGYGNGSPAWHPSGAIVAYYDEVDSGNMGIFITMADGTTANAPVAIIDNPNADYFDIAWSAAGDRFAVERYYPDISDVEVFNFEYNPSDPMSSGVTADGESLVRDGPIADQCEPPGCSVIGIGWAKSLPAMVADHIAVGVELDTETYTIWCIEVDNPSTATNLSYALNLNDLRYPDWSPSLQGVSGSETTELVVGKSTFVRKGGAKVGRYDSSLEVLELSYDNSFGCPVATWTRTFQDPPLGDFIGRAKWRP